MPLLPRMLPPCIRPIKPEDEPLLVDFAKRMTAEDLRMRFFATFHELSHELAHRLSHIDPEREAAVVAQPDGSDEIIGVARFSCGREKQDAEFALAVRSDWQDHGLGWLLMAQLVEIAHMREIRCLYGLVLCENQTMRRFCHDFGFTAASNPDDPTTIRVFLDPKTRCTTTRRPAEP